MFEKCYVQFFSLAERAVQNWDFQSCSPQFFYLPSPYLFYLHFIFLHYTPSINLSHRTLTCPPILFPYPQKKFPTRSKIENKKVFFLAFNSTPRPTSTCTTAICAIFYNFSLKNIQRVFLSLKITRRTTGARRCEF